LLGRSEPLLYAESSEKRTSPKRNESAQKEKVYANMQAEKSSRREREPSIPERE